MSWSLGLLLRQVRRSQDPAGELVRRTHVHQVLRPDGVDRLLAERPDRQVRLASGVAGLLAGGHLATERSAVQLPFLAAAVEQLDVRVPVEREVPVGIGGEPVVVAPVEHHCVVVGDALLREQLPEAGLVHEVADHRVLQLGLPVDADRARDVATLVRGGVLVDLDEHHPGCVEVVLGPVGGYQDVLAAHADVLPVGRKAGWSVRCRPSGDGIGRESGRDVRTRADTPGCAGG